MTRRHPCTAFAFALLSAACGPTIEEVCEDLQRCPEPVGGDCEVDGERLEAMAEEARCEESFSDYLDCLDQAGCSWREACEELRDTMTECVGELPA